MAKKSAKTPERRSLRLAGEAEAPQAPDTGFVVVALRVAANEREKLHAAAMKVGGRQYLSQWMRETLLKEAERVLGK